MLVPEHHTAQSNCAQGEKEMDRQRKKGRRSLLHVLGAVLCVAMGASAWYAWQSWVVGGAPNEVVLGEAICIFWFWFFSIYWWLTALRLAGGLTHEDT